MKRGDALGSLDYLWLRDRKGNWADEQVKGACNLWLTEWRTQILLRKPQF
jgi:hypothetical protein